MAKPIHIRQLIETIMQHTGRRDGGNGQDASRGHGHQSRQILRSEFDDDPDLQDVIDKFIAAMPGLVEAMRQALDHGDHDRLRQLAHQLKGTGGSYGYPALTDVGKRLEDAAGTCDIEGATLALNELAELAQSVVAGQRRQSTGGVDQ
jgi:HPt (histidine-containing phosphotransfer) domain-containing protein